MINYMPKNRYSAMTFHGIMPDSGAIGVLTAGHPQFQTLWWEILAVILDWMSAGKATIRFGNESTLESIGTMMVPTPLGPINFYIIPANMPFLLCLQDMDWL